MGNQVSRSASVAVSTTSTQVIPVCPPGMRRVSWSVQNTSVAAVVSVSKGINKAVAGEGVVLQITGTDGESNSEGFTCWQDPIQAVANAAGTVAIQETYEVLR